MAEAGGSRESGAVLCIAAKTDYLSCLIRAVIDAPDEQRRM